MQAAPAFGQSGQHHRTRWQVWWGHLQKVAWPPGGWRSTPLLVAHGLGQWSRADCLPLAHSLLWLPCCCWTWCFPKETVEEARGWPAAGPRRQQSRLPTLIALALQRAKEQCALSLSLQEQLFASKGGPPALLSSWPRASPVGMSAGPDRSRKFPNPYRAGYSA